MGPPERVPWQSRIIARLPRTQADCGIRSFFACLGGLEVSMANHPVLGYLVWAVLIGAVFAWEGLALSGISGSVPTLSATFRAIMRYPPGRWALFALWLWLGWHLFVRGWHFLLRA
jgi:Family of unknown function (DUF6186)